MAILTGERLGPYEIVSAIGAGGMGEVYRARDTRLNRTVVIRTLELVWPCKKSSAERICDETLAILR